jgi:hypothetical protein
MVVLRSITVFAGERQHDSEPAEPAREKEANVKYMVIAVVALALAGASFASNGSENREPSACGAAHGAFADANGSFGFLGGEGGTPGYHNGAVGQDTGATGYNNSHTNCHS